MASRFLFEYRIEVRGGGLLKKGKVTIIPIVLIVSPPKVNNLHDTAKNF